MNMTTFYSYIQVEEGVGILEQGVPTKRQLSIAETIGQLSFTGTDLAQIKKRPMAFCHKPLL